MKARVVMSIFIAASPAEVFKFMADLHYHPQWNPPLQRVEPVSLLKEGMEYRMWNLLFGMKVTGLVKVKKLIPSKRLDLNSITGMLKYEVSYRLNARDNGTDLACRISVSTESRAFAFAKPMMHLLAKRELQADLDALKQLAEQ